MRTRVQVVINQFGLGGTEVHVAMMARALRDEFDVRIFALHAGGGAAVEPLRAAGVPVEVGAPSAGLGGRLRAMSALLAALRRDRPHVLHFFLPEAYLIGGLVSLAGPRTVRLMSRRSLNAYQLRRPGSRTAERWLHRTLDGALANSRAVLAELREEGLPEDAVGLIYNGVRRSAEPIPSRTAARARLGIAPDAFVMAIVANLIGYKGHDDLLTALELVHERLPTGWRLVVAGEDRDAAAAIRARAAVGPLAGHVAFVGRQDPPTDIFAAADLVVSASHEEGFSNAVLEAMAAGLPCVVTDVGGNPEAVRDGIDGLVVPPRAPDALAAALIRMALDATARDVMGAAAAARVQERFSVERCVSAYRRVYRAARAGTLHPLSITIDAPT